MLQTSEPHQASWPIGGEMGERIRAFDWSQTSLGPLKAWPQSLKATVDLVLASPMPMNLLWGPDLVQIYNDAFRPYFGTKHPASLGQPARECWVEIWPESEPLNARVLAGETVVLANHPWIDTRDGDPEEICSTTSLIPLRDDSGAVVGILTTASETTHHVRAEAELTRAEQALRESDARLRAALEIETVGVIRLALEGPIIEANDAFLAMGGYSRADLEAGRLTWQGLTPPEWMEASEQAVAELKENGQSKPYEKEYLRKNGSRWCGLFAAKMLPDSTIFEFVLDITARKQAEQALATELKAMTRLHDVSRQVVNGAGLQAVLDAILEAAIELHGADFGNIQLFDDKTRTLRIAAQRGFQKPFLDHFAEVDVAEGSACGMALARRERVMIEDVETEPAYAPSLQAAREAGYRAVQSTPLFTPTGETLGMLSTHFRQPHRLSELDMRLTDIYARLAAEAIAQVRAEVALRESESQARLLLAELQHRVRNTLAVIRSIARQTAETSETVEDYAMHLDGRLDAFARVQGAVTRDPCAGIDLSSMVAEELLTCAAREGEQFSLSGPTIRLQPKAAETVGLAIHELATNAVKYGALSSPKGHVTVAWRLEDQNGGQRLRIEWSETGVPVLSLAPRRSGFGTELLTQTLPYQFRGTTTLTFKPGGLQCTIELPSNRVLQ
ncbi:PAS domain-containing sensor histidine kinase [Microvirga vignae]|uniref:PAS domain-containing sensor histidine kinase n=1 Tax=Microvirga vignae TaxID=1225564 RepID=UPI000AFA11DD|nr:HWE histidine kinase domain-containing protein [Microvirga vignae]